MEKKMKRIVVLLVMVIAFCCCYACDDNVYTAESYEDWLNTDKAMDYNGNGKINKDDYDIYCDYIAWKNTDNAFDYNTDRYITFEDYAIITFYSVWRQSNSVFDYNGSGIIDEGDFIVFKNYNSWKLSKNAKDFNGDTIIDYADYSFSTEYEKWLNSSSKLDINKDGKIDEEDYKKYTVYKDLVGSFTIQDFYYTRNMKLYNTEITLLDIYYMSDRLLLSVDYNGKVDCSIPEDEIERLGDSLDNIRNALSNCVFQKLSSNVYTITTVLKNAGYNVDIPFYLVKGNNGVFSTTIEFSGSDFVSSVITFKLVKQNTL